jgi:hypothetical protein
MILVVTVLIYTVSLEFQLPACIVIHNHCLNTKLVSPVYFSNGALCPKLFDQQIDIGTEVRACFKIDAIKNRFESALLFKLKRHVGYNDQHNIDTLITETGENEATHVHMLVVWEMKDARPFAYVVLVEHTKEFTWSKDKLKKLYYENHDQLNEYGARSDIWLMDDNTALKTSLNVRDLKDNPELTIFIYGTKIYPNAMRPIRINHER